MKATGLLLATAFGVSLIACGGSDSSDGNSAGDTKPGSPTNVSVAPGDTAGTAVVSFTAPTSTGSSAITSYIVTASPGGITATGTSSPITLTGLTTATAYAYSVVATNGEGSSGPATTKLLRFYSVVETFLEPETDPDDTIFLGVFTFEPATGTVSNLRGLLSESMTGTNGVAYPNDDMTWITLSYQLSSVTVTPGDVDGLLVTTFYLSTTDTFDPSGFAPGGTKYFGHSSGALNPASGGVGNAYAMIFVNTTDPTTALVQAQIDRLAYADCTAGGMMGSICMTGTTVAGYGRVGTMEGYPESQVVTER